MGGPLTLTNIWAYSRLKRMNMIKRKGSCSAKMHIADTEFEKLKEGYLSKIHKAVTDHGTPPELIYKWDHSGLNYVPVSNWTMETFVH